MRIRLRLALFGAVVTAAAMIVFALLLTALARAAAPADQDASLGRLADTAATAIATAPADRLTPTAPPILIDPAMSTEPFIEVADDVGRVLYSTGGVGGAPPPIPAAVVVEALDTGTSGAVYELGDGTEIRVQARRWEHPATGRGGIVVAAQPTRFAQEQIAGLVAVLWVAGIITMIAATVVGWLVSGRALRPLRRLVETTDEIGTTGDLTRRLSPPASKKDEVARLTESFNTMLSHLEDSQRRLEAALEAQRRFVADASHELRSPLTTIRSNAGLLLERSDVTPEDRNEAIADIAAEANRMARLVDDLLELARADAGVATTRRSVAIGEIAASVVRRARRLGHEIALDVQDDPRTQGDAEALERLVWILVDNAIRHGDPPIEVSASTDDGTVVLSVRDHGPGVPPEQRLRIFERFHRLDTARSPDGAGLGLAIAHDIALRHSGEIEVSTPEGGGTRFTVRLPSA